MNSDVANEMNDNSTMNKIMEYMALGKPIVQFDLTEGRFSAQEASLYATPNDPVRRARMGEFGSRRIRDELEWCCEAPKLPAAYKALWRTARKPATGTPHA